MPGEEKGEAAGSEKEEEACRQQRKRIGRDWRKVETVERY